MDLRDYLSFIPRNTLLIIASGVIFIVLALLYTTAYSKTFYKADLMVTATIEDVQNTDDFKYSNYYNEFTANNFINTLEGWFEQPNLIHNTYKNAGVDMNSDLSIGGKILGPITVKKKNRGNLKINFKSKKREHAESLSIALSNELNQRVGKYNEITKSNYRLIPSDAFISESKPKPLFNGLIALIIGLLFGVVLSYTKELLTGKVSTISQAQEHLATPSTLLLSRSDEKSDKDYLKSLKMKLKNISIVNCCDKDLIHFTEQKSLKLEKHYDEIAKLDSTQPIFIYIHLGITTLKDIKKLYSLIPTNPKYLIIKA